MTFKDRQHFKILKALVYTEGKEISSEEFKKVFTDTFGNSASSIQLEMTEQNLIKDVSRKKMPDGDHVHTSFVTSSGIDKYKLLKTQKRNQFIRNLVVGLTLFFAAAGFAYQLLTYYVNDDESNGEAPSQQDTMLPQTQESTVKETQGHTQYEGNGVQSLGLTDSLTNTKELTKLKDTAALKHNPINKTHN